MNGKTTIGVRFIEKTKNHSFISRSNKTYFYNFDITVIDKLIGNICKLDGYSNFILPVCQISFQSNAKYFSERQITTIARASSESWCDADTSQEAIELALRLEEDYLTYESQDWDDDEEDNFYETINDNSAPITINNEKENTIMNMMPNMTFGPYNNKRVALSFYGLAVQNPATSRWFSYKGEESYDVTDFLINGMNNMVFAMPVALKKIAVGDIILHNNVPMVVKNEGENSLEAFDLANNEIKQIVPAKSPFGFNFCTKLISMFDGGMFGDEDEDNIFGGMDPMMMMAMSGGFGSNSFSDGENPMGNMMQTMFMMKAMKNIM